MPHRPQAPRARSFRVTAGSKDPRSVADVAAQLKLDLSRIDVLPPASQEATRLADEKLTTQERQALTRAMLFDEAFALHSLEDMFSAGHIAGTCATTRREPTRRR